MLGDFVTAGQTNPVEVPDRIVEVVEAETTTENNVVPANRSD